MPRSNSRSRSLTKNNDVKSKKRKRTEEEDDAKRNKRFKNGWIRDIRAVLRSATKSQKPVNKEKKNVARKSVSTNTNINLRHHFTENQNLKSCENFLSNDTFSEEQRNENLNPDLRPESIIDDVINEIEESCIFQTITCNTSGSLIRLENIPRSILDRRPDETCHDCSNNVLIENLKNKEGNNKTGYFWENNGGTNEIEVISDENIFDEDAVVANVETENKNESDFKESIFSNDTINFTDNHNSYYFGKDDNENHGRLDLGYVFALGQSLGERSEIDGGLTASNAVALNVNDIEQFENVLSFDPRPNSTIDNCDQMWVGVYREDCRERGRYFPEQNVDYPSVANSLQGTESGPMAKEPMAPQAYYDASRGAFVESSMLQDPTPSTSKTLKDTWGSIKNLISRVSGKKNDENQDDVTTN